MTHIKSPSKNALITEDFTGIKELFSILTHVKDSIMQTKANVWVDSWMLNMFDGQSQRADIPAHARIGQNGFQQKKKKTGRGSLLNRPSGLPRTPLSSRGLN